MVVFEYLNLNSLSVLQPSLYPAESLELELKFWVLYP